MSERLACKAVGLARSTYRRLPLAATPADPDAQLRAWLRAYATKHPCHGFRRAWAALRYDERREVNKKKVHRLWREEGLQVRVHSPRKRAGVSSVPVVEADAPKVVWALDFQFDSTIDGKAIKIASMIDEHAMRILEGLLIGYLPASAHDEILDATTALSAPGSRIAADHIDSRRSDAVSESMNKLHDIWRKLDPNLNLQSLTFSGPRQDPAGYLAERGWTTHNADLADLFRAAGRPGSSATGIFEQAEFVRFLSGTCN